MVLENVTSVVPSAVDIQYLFGSVANILALSACIAGITFQTVIKWWDKWQDGQPIAFDKKFIGTAVATLIGSISIAIPLLGASSQVLQTNIPTYGLIFAWFVTAAWAYALNNGVNGIVTKLLQKGGENLLKSGKIDRLIAEKVALRLNEGIEVLQNEGQLQKASSTDIQPPKDTIGGSDSVTQP
jgi:hypothetical protein